MAVREFTTRDGRAWRVWNVTPESLQPSTRAEDYLADYYSDGWVVFETLDGAEKRRLYPPPYGWELRSESELEALLMRAEIFRPRDQVRVRGDEIVPADLPAAVPVDIANAMPRDLDGTLDMGSLGVVRGFTDTGGMRWRASIVEIDPDRPRVLRFSSESRSIDFTSWPADWIDLTDDEMIALLRAAESPEARRRQDPSPRRHDDPEPGPPAT